MGNGQETHSHIRHSEGLTRSSDSSTLATSVPTVPRAKHDPLTTRKGVHVPAKFSSVQNDTMSCAVADAAVKARRKASKLVRVLGVMFVR